MKISYLLSGRETVRGQAGEGRQRSSEIWNNAALRNLYSIRDNWRRRYLLNFTLSRWPGEAFVYRDRDRPRRPLCGERKTTGVQARRREILDLARERKGRRACAHQWRPPTLIYSNQNGRPSAFRTFETFHVRPVLSWRGSSLQRDFAGHRSGILTLDARSRNDASSRSESRSTFSVMIEINRRRAMPGPAGVRFAC